MDRIKANDYYVQGQNAFHNGEYVKSGIYLRKAASLGLREALLFMAQNADVLNNKEVLADKQGNRELANQYYRYAIDLMPEDDDALLNLALNYKNEGRLQEIHEKCNRNLPRRPKEAHTPRPPTILLQAFSR